MTPQTPEAHPPATSVAPLASLASLRFEGPDAGAFLHAQLSSDVGALRPGATQRTSYLSPKGRVLANLVLWRGTGEGAPIGAVLAADLAPTIARRLSMFVLRSKVKVVDPGPARERVGLAGPRAAELLAAILGGAPAPGAALEQDDVVMLGLPDGRILVDATPERAAALRQALANAGATSDENAWWLAQVRAGVPLVTAATTDQFVPQALNLDALGGVSFQKGCYPGQEIVARTQYLGRLKERLYALAARVPPPPAGARLFAATFGDQPCGTVINAASVEGGCELLAVAQSAAAEGDTLHLYAVDGPVLARTALPYALPEPARPRERTV